MRVLLAEPALQAARGHQRSKYETRPFLPHPLSPGLGQRGWTLSWRRPHRATEGEPASTCTPTGGSRCPALSALPGPPLCDSRRTDRTGSPGGGNQDGAGLAGRTRSGPLVSPANLREAVAEPQSSHLCEGPSWVPGGRMKYRDAEGPVKRRDRDGSSDQRLCMRQ